MPTTAFPARPAARPQRSEAAAPVAVPPRPDLDLGFIVAQLRGTFEARLDQLLALAADHPDCAGHTAALDAVNAALARVHDGTYGMCHGCGRSISAARLEVVPTTTTCVRCSQPGAGR